MKTVTKSGAALASMAFAMAISGATLVAPTASSAQDATVHCAGVNSCAGHGECKTASNDCKGLNSCKGKGFISLTTAECTKQGGTVLEG
jgi:hypothetical protein